MHELGEGIKSLNYCNIVTFNPILSQSDKTTDASFCQISFCTNFCADTLCKHKHNHVDLPIPIILVSLEYLILIEKLECQSFNISKCNFEREIIFFLNLRLYFFRLHLKERNQEF